ncbi:MAG: universal stress protein [Pirellulales bacterium]
MTAFQRVLCAVDFSDTSSRALLYAERLARETGAELTLLHAFDAPVSYDAAGQYEPARQEIKRQFDELAPMHPEVKVDRVMHAGPPGEVICWLAQERHCDLIVMGTHGRTGLRHLMLGSVAEYVVRHARCPVTVVRDPPAQELPLTEPRVLPLPAPPWM